MENPVPTSWDDARAKLDDLLEKCNTTINATASDIAKYPTHINDGEALSQLLANINWYVHKLGEFHSKTEAIKLWSEKRYEIEKGLETVRIIKVEKKAANYAKEAKYENVQQFLDIMVLGSALHLRVQNARSNARDITEALRSRIGQLRGQQRSS